MALSNDQIVNLIGMVSSVEKDAIDCDGCFSKIHEFAEIHLSAKEVPEAMKVVKSHLEQCLCCQDEFNALLKGLKALEE